MVVPCSIEDPCKKYEARWCNNSEQCQGNLVCGSSINCPFVVASHCCYDKLVNGDIHFCSVNNTCGHHVGDCDYDNECHSGLKCGKDNCPKHLGGSSFIDCCYLPAKGDEYFCTKDNQCGHHEGDCDDNNECQHGLQCGTDNCPASFDFDTSTDCCYNQTLLNIGEHYFCTNDNLCGENEGDCDNNNQCQGDLECGTDNCPSYLEFDYSIDCCYKKENGDKNFCYAGHHCGHHEGDCDNDNDCESGLICGTDNCPSFLGFDSVKCDATDYDPLCPFYALSGNCTDENVLNKI